jgi:hypothetical protein
MPLPDGWSSLEARGGATLKQATDAVDKAWRRWKEDPNAQTEAAYDRAYASWKELGSSRGVGRPVSGDQTPLTSTERAQAARARQQQSAAKWERVAPIIQHIRRAVEASDDTTILQLAKSFATYNASADWRSPGIIPFRDHRGGPSLAPSALPSLSSIFR